MIDRKKFAIAALMPDREIFVIYMAYLVAKMSIYLAQELLIALLLAKEIYILKKYADFLDVFSK